jgi:hypothetical protein
MSSVVSRADSALPARAATASTLAEVLDGE